MAKQLISKHGLTQEEVACKMGITQSAVSQYMTSKRATRGNQLGINYPLVESMAHEAADKIANNQMKADEIITYFCELCTTMKENNYVI
jgi:predicted transcriptional regulator